MDTQCIKNKNITGSYFFFFLTIFFFVFLAFLAGITFSPPFSIWNFDIVYVIKKVWLVYFQLVCRKSRVGKD
jgi:hypothetical protein